MRSPFTWGQRSTAQRGTAQHSTVHSHQGMLAANTDAGHHVTASPAHIQVHGCLISCRAAVRCVPSSPAAHRTEQLLCHLWEEFPDRHKLRVILYQCSQRHQRRKDLLVRQPERGGLRQEHSAAQHSMTQLVHHPDRVCDAQAMQHCAAGTAWHGCDASRRQPSESALAQLLLSELLGLALLGVN